MIRAKILIALSSLFTVGVLALPVMGGVAFAQDTGPTTAQQSPEIINGLCEGVNLRVGSNCQSGGITNDQAKEKINRVITQVINLFSLVVGVVSVIMIIFGGLRYITSGGDSTNVNSAKNTILYAVIGLIVVALAQVIVRFVLGKVAAT